MVDFFFLLSGFIMMHVYGPAFERALSWREFGRFMQARFARIYPLHLFTFLVLLVEYRILFYGKPLEGFLPYVYNPNAIITNLLLLQSMGFHPFINWNVPAWSISTEWWMYVLFPVVFLGFRNLHLWKLIVIFLAIVAGYLAVFYLLYPLSKAASPFPSSLDNSLDVTYDYGFIRCFFGFVLGMWLYELYRRRWLETILRSDLLFPVTVLVVWLLMHYAMPDYLVVFCFAALLLMTVYNAGRVNQLLSTRPLLFLGDISYSIYLLHAPILFIGLDLAHIYAPGFIFDSSPWQATFYIVLFLLILVGLSVLSYYAVELPMRKWLGPGKRMKS